MTENKLPFFSFLTLILKPIVLFVSGLYLLGFVWFPLLGFGNYVLVNVDFLLPSEWVFLTILGIVLIVWSFKSVFDLRIRLNAKK